MSSTQTIRKRPLEAGVSFAPNDTITEHLRPDDIEVIQAEGRANEIKHPVGKPADIQNLLSLPIDHALKPEIWLQPLSQSRTATELCIREATARNWRVSIQTQKFIGVR